MFVMTKYSHHSTAEFGVQLGRRKERCSGLKMLSQTYLYWDFIGFLPCNALRGALVWLPSGTAGTHAHLNTLFTGFFCLPCMFTAGMDSTKQCAPSIGAWKRREVKFSYLEQEGSKRSWGELPVDLLAGTLHCGTWGGVGGETSPPGVWEGLKTGKQVLGVVSAGSHILECSMGKEIPCKLS